MAPDVTPKATPKMKLTRIAPTRIASTRIAPTRIAPTKIAPTKVRPEVKSGLMTMNVAPKLLLYVKSALLREKPKPSSITANGDGVAAEQKMAPRYVRKRQAMIPLRQLTSPGKKLRLREPRSKRKQLYPFLP